MTTSATSYIPHTVRDEQQETRVSVADAQQNYDTRGSFITSYHGHLGRAEPPQNLEFE